MKLFDELRLRAKRADDIHNEARGLYWGAQARMRLGQIDVAIDQLKDSLALITHHNELTEHGWIVVTNGLLALANAYQGRYSETHVPLAKVTAASITSFAIFEGYASAAETKLLLWEHGDTTQNWSECYNRR